MHTIELDAETESALIRLANSAGKPPEVWLQEAVLKLLKTCMEQEPLPSLAALRANQPMQKTSEGDFVRAMRDEARY